MKSGSRPARMVLLCVAVMLAGCAPADEWIKPGVSDTQRDRDAADCLFESSGILSTKEGPQQRVDQDRYLRCMSQRGYAAKKAGE